MLFFILALLAYVIEVVKDVMDALSLCPVYYFILLH